MKDIVEVYGKMNYSQVYTRIPPYLLGILLGWIIHITKNKNFNINRVRTQYKASRLPSAISNKLKSF